MGNIVSLWQVRKAYGDRVVLRSVTVGIDAGEKVGLVGCNGSGKSTLFRVLAGREEPDGGTVARHRELSTGYLPQEPTLPAGRTVWQVASSGLETLLDARRRAEEVAAGMAAGAGDESRSAELADRYDGLQREIERLGGWDTDYRVEELLQHLGVAEVARAPVEQLSGGQQKRVALARVLLMRPSLLVLDEPTNHLDADTVDWLEGFLATTDAAVALVTHDRYVLDRVVGRMLELRDGEVIAYQGNYTTFLQQKAGRLSVEQRTDARRRRLVEQELEWLGRTPSARRHKQKARARRIDALETEGTTARERELSLHFQPSERIRGDTILNAIGVEIGFGERRLIGDLTLRMVRGDRVGIVGPNGCGKTTLLRVLLGQEQPRAGRIEVGRQTKIGYFDQDRAGIPPDATLPRAVAPNSDYVRLGGQKIHIRRFLEDFLFPVSEHGRQVATLSGGERNRLLLARVVAEGANLLVLDEPTNDLDLDTLQILEDALARFSSCLLVVTHDRYFLNRVANRILAFVGDGEVRAYAGDYDFYRRTRARELQEERAAARSLATDDAPPPIPIRAPRPRVGLSWKEERELEQLESEVARLEEHRGKLEARLASPGPLAGDPSKLRRLSERHAEVAAALELRYERWTELMERKEEAGG